jgi:hypothetical protein
MQFKLGSTTYVATQRQVTIKGMQAAYDCSGSMSRYLPVLKSAAIKSTMNGIRTILFSTTARVLDDDVTEFNFPTDGLHYMRGTQYIPAFKAFLEDCNVDPDANLMFMTDGEPYDFPDVMPIAKEIHAILAQGSGKLQFYYLGQPFEHAMKIMRALSFPPQTEPLVFNPDSFDQVMHGVMGENVPIDADVDGVSTGIWRVTKLGEDEKSDAEQDLTQCKVPEIAIACVAAILNFMKLQNIHLTHADAKHLNSEVLQKFNQRQGVVELMDSVRELAADSGSAGMSDAMALLMRQANVVTGTVPTKAVIDRALAALVRNPDPAYAQQSRAAREDRKALQKVKARFAGTNQKMSLVLNRAAKHTVEYMQTQAPSYRLSKVRVLPSAVCMNPPCLDVTCDGVIYPFATGGSDALLPVGCQSRDYIESLVFNLFGGQIYTQNAPLALLNAVFHKPAMLSPIVSALKNLAPFPGFPEFKATVPFAFDPDAISAAHFLFYPHFASTHVADAFVHAIVATLHSACEPLDLDMSRVTSQSTLNFQDLTAEFGANNCNVSELSKRAFPTADLDTRIKDLPAMRAQILASYKASPQAPEGIARAVPDLQTVLEILRFSIDTLMPQGLDGMSGELLLDHFVVQAGMRLSVAASIGATSSAGKLHRCEIDTTRPGRVRFFPSEEHSLQLLVSCIESVFVVRGHFDQLRKLETSPLVYLRLAGNNSESARHVVSLIDWYGCIPTSAWPREALKWASVAEMAPHVNSAVAIANLEGKFNAKWFNAESVARILTTAENCIAENVQDRAAVLAILPKDARSMRNALSLFDNLQDALQLLEVPEGGALTPDQIALGRKLQSIDAKIVEHLEDALKDDSLTRRIMDHWLRCFHKPEPGKANPTTAEIIEFFFRKHTKKNAKLDANDDLDDQQRERHRRVFNPKQTAVEYYRERKAMYKHGRAQRRTEVLGMLLRLAGEKL